MKTLLALGLVIVTVLGGLYLYMNRYDYVRLKIASGGSELYLRINTLTGYECVVHQGPIEDIIILGDPAISTAPFCDEDKESQAHLTRQLLKSS